MQETIKSDLMREAECAALLDVSPKTLANQRSRREGPPYVRLSGRGIRYSRKAIAVWLAQRSVTPQDGAA